MPVVDGPSCPGCGLANYEGMCPVCRGDEQATWDEGLPYPWPECPCKTMADCDASRFVHCRLSEAAASTAKDEQ